MIDFDVVEPSNVTTQGYRAADCGQPKVTALRAAVLEIEPALVIDVIAERFRPTQIVHNVVFCCVDSISSRAAIWRSVQDRCRCWIDGRMLGEVIRVLTVAEEQGRQHYPRTLFAQSEAQPGRCAARGTIYTAQIAAGLMLHQFTRGLRGLPVAPDQTLNLLAGELCVGG